MEKAVQKKRDLYPMWTVIALFMMFGFGKVVPAWSTLTQLGVCMLGVFLGTLIMTIFTNQTFWPAVIAMVAMVFHGYLTASDALSGWFGSSTLQQFIWIMALCGALRESGAPVVIAKNMLNLKFCKGHPYLFVYIVFVTTAVVSTLLNPTATILLMFPILDGIYEAAGFDSDVKNDREFKKEMLLGIYISAMSAYIFPFKGVQMTSIASIKAVMEGMGMSFDDGAYFISTLACLIVFTFLYLCCMRFVWKTDVSKLQSFDMAAMEGMNREDLRLNKRQIILLCAVGVGLLYTVSLIFIPTGWAGYETYSGMTTTWVWIAIFAVMCMLRMDGKPFIDGNKVLRNHTMWGVVALIGCFTFCGNAISSDALGIKTWISELLTPLLGNAGWIPMVLVVILISTICTNFMNGMPVTFTLVSVVVPFACNAAATQGINPTVMGAAIIFSGMCAFLTYGSITYAAVLLSREDMDKRFIWTKGVTVVAVYIISAVLVFGVCGYIL